VGSQKTLAVPSAFTTARALFLPPARAPSFSVSNNRLELSFYKSIETFIVFVFFLGLERESRREQERETAGAFSPSDPPSSRLSPPALRLGGLAHQLPPDDQPPDLRGAGSDLVELGVAEDPA